MGTLQSQLQLACNSQMEAERGTQASASALAVAQAELAALHAIIRLGPDARHHSCQVPSDCASAAQHSQEPRQGLLVRLCCCCLVPWCRASSDHRPGSNQGLLVRLWCCCLWAPPVPWFMTRSGSKLGRGLLGGSGSRTG